MSTVITILLWLVEHWYVVAAVGAIIMAAALWGGIVSIAAIVNALLAIAAQVVKFFATPADQIAAKALYGFVVAVLAGSLFWQIGKHDERAVWLQAEAERAAAMERLKDETAAEAQRRVDAVTAAEREKTKSAEKRIKDYEAQHPVTPTGDCRIDDDDLRAAGDMPRANRLNLRRHPARVQQDAQRSPAR